MKTFKVKVTRTIEVQIELTADGLDEKEAMIAAIIQAGKIDFNLKGRQVGVEYSAQVISEM